MGLMSRRKGQAGERELAAEIHAATGWEVKRRVRQHEGDSDLEGVPGWSVESKRHARATRGDIAGWWAQAVAQAARTGDRPALFYRANRDEWRAVWSLGLHLGAHWPQYELTVEGSVSAWAATARELQPAPTGATPAAGRSKGTGP